MQNTLALGNIDWENVSESSSLSDVSVAIDHTRQVVSANSVSLDYLKIQVPYENSLYFLGKLKQKILSKGSR